LVGCADFWEDITSRDEPFSQRCKEVFSKPDPLVVLRDSTDGDRRAKALRRLTEPKQRGGTDSEQNMVVEILSKTAASDPQPLCRLIAIEKLGHFKDPRVAKALEAAFYGVDTIPSQFADLTTRIQCQAISSMGECGNPEVIPLLTQVLKEPPADRSDEALHRNDRCTAAARSLAHFNEAQATEALLHVMQNKKEDIALRDCAYTALEKATGKNMPNDPQAWEDFLHPKDGSAIAQQKSKGFNIVPVGWFSRDAAPPAPEPKTPSGMPTALPPAIPDPKTLGTAPPPPWNTPPAPTAGAQPAPTPTPAVPPPVPPPVGPPPGPPRQ
jgi:hypothetical protein